GAIRGPLRPFPCRARGVDRLKPLGERYAAALAVPNIPAGLLPFQRSWRIGRDERMAERDRITGRSFADLKHESAAYKPDVLANWSEYIDQFRRNAEAAGSVVTEVSTPAEACAYVTSVCRKAGTSLVIKGKSMVSEEIGLNAALAGEGISAIESDL